MDCHVIALTSQCKDIVKELFSTRETLCIPSKRGERSDFPIEVMEQTNGLIVSVPKGYNVVASHMMASIENIIQKQGLIVEANSNQRTVRVSHLKKNI